jgi:SanA protein
MRQHALSLGVPEDAILTDRAGLRTYDTCYRAREVFGLRSAILVTQHFHLPRALFTCRGLGVEAVGVAADNYYYLKRSRLYWNVRELFATFGAFVDLYVKQPAPLVVSSEAIRARAN